MRSFILIALFCCSKALAADTTRYTIITTEKITGKQLMWSDGQGKVSYWYEYNDRGRGPKIRVDLVLDNEGLVISRKAQGLDYFKGPVSETFEIANGVAKWKNKIEQGEKNISGLAIYSGMNGAPGEIEWDVKLMLKQHTHEMEMLPAGKLKTTHIKSHTAKVNGFPEELELYAVSGSGGPPEYVWVTPKKEYFATISSWSSIIKQGYEFLVPELKKLQEKMEEEYFEIQDAQLTQTLSMPLAFTNVSVFDSKTGKVLKDQTVVVENGKISQVGKAKKIHAPANAKIIQGAGKMLLPGLWDNHVHFGVSDGLYHIAAGVTNVKDLGNSLDLPANIKKVNDDILIGPEIAVISGFIDYAGPYAGPTGKIVKTLDEGKAAVNYYADHGYQQIKLYSSIPVDWVQPLAAEAHKRGLKVCGHIPSGMTAERAINDGYDQIIHMNMVMLNFMGDSIDTRSMGRLTRVGEMARNIDMNSAEVRRFVKLLKDKNIVVDPTMAIFENMFAGLPGTVAASHQPVRGMLPPEVLRSVSTGGLPSIATHESEYRQSYDNMLKMIKVLYDNGITIVPGTDASDGFTLHRELELYAKAGIPNAEVLKMATMGSAKVALKESELGSIEVGKKANLILVDGDPVKNMADIRRVEFTVKAGNFYDCRKLYDSYGFGFWK